ncbi:MAG: putative peptidylprolyl isomerase PrsA [uncultured bacterium]|nr:MAG: putative peptidylprolyl isomerase PrsA [uncultured bacterium]
MKTNKFVSYAKSVWREIKTFFILIWTKIKSVKFLSKIFKKSNIKKGKVWKIARLVILIIIGIYLVGAIVFGIFVYKYNSEARAVKVAVKMYPFPIAWANGHSIVASSFYSQLNYIRHFSDKSGQAIEDDVTLKNQILDQLVDQEITREQAKKNHVKVTKDDINQAFYKIADQNGGTSEVEKVLNEMYGMDVSQFKSMIKEQMYTEKIQSNLISQVNAKHILIKDEAKAKDVLEQAKKGEKSFEDLAKEFSEDTGSKDNGGDLNWFSRGQMVKEFEDAAFSQEVGKVGDNLIKSEYGYHIIKVIEKKGTIDKSFTDWMTEVKSKAKIHKWINFKASQSDSSKESQSADQPSTEPAAIEATQ